MYVPQEILQLTLLHIRRPSSE